MKVEKSVQKTENITLHCGEWRACIHRPSDYEFSLWQIHNGRRFDTDVTKDSIKELKLLVEAILSEL